MKNNISYLVCTCTTFQFFSYTAVFKTYHIQHIHNILDIHFDFLIKEQKNTTIYKPTFCTFCAH